MPPIRSMHIQLMQRNKKEIKMGNIMETIYGETVFAQSLRSLKKLWSALQKKVLKAADMAHLLKLLLVRRSSAPFFRAFEYAAFFFLPSFIDYLAVGIQSG